MIERVARAISLGEWSDSEHWQCRDEREVWIERARAAIEAMREPTEAMVKAGFHKNVFDNSGGCRGVPPPDKCADWHDDGAVSAYLKQTGVCRVSRVTKSANEAYRAMIDAALSPKPETPER